MQSLTMIGPLQGVLAAKRLKGYIQVEKVAYRCVLAGGCIKLWEDHQRTGDAMQGGSSWGTR